MNNPVRLVLMIVAIVCFLLAAFGVTVPRGDLKAAGLACWALATLWQT
jgi:hypothetical protein